MINFLVFVICIVWGIGHILVVGSFLTDLSKLHPLTNEYKRHRGTCVLAIVITGGNLIVYGKALGAW